MDLFGKGRHHQCRLAVNSETVDDAVVNQISILEVTCASSTSGMEGLFHRRRYLMLSLP